MSIATHKDDLQLLTVHYDTEGAIPTRYIIWFEGRDYVVVAEEGEFPGAVWERVLSEVRFMRQVVAISERLDPYLRDGRLRRGNPYRVAHVYAGIEPTPEQVKGHMRQWIEWSLWRLADPRRNDNGDERVAALCALSELYGLTAPRLFR